MKKKAKERASYIKKIPYTPKNAKRYNLPENFPCFEPQCNNKPAYIVIESDGLFSIVYGVCKEHSKNMKPMFW